MGTFRAILELIYFISGPILVIIAGIGLRQLKIAKDASRLQATRESLSLSADRCSHYISNIIPLVNNLSKSIKENDIKYFSLFEVSVNGDSIRISPKGSKQDLNKEHDKLPTIISELLPVYNSLEAFSVFFTHRVADEEVAFSSVGHTFCYSVRNYLPDLFPYSRSTGHYKNLIKLFLIWNTRIESEKLKLDRQRIENELSKIEDKFVRPIGTES